MPDAALQVLVTGSSGLIGGVVIRTLGDKYTFSGLDRVQTADAPDIPTTVADVSNFDAIRPAFDGMDAVIHLAADAGMHAPWSSILPNNIVATYNVFEAARQAGVPRLIFANLDPATFPRIEHTVRIRPDGYYGISKAFGEAMGAYYTENCGMSVICLRIGTVNRHNSPMRDIRHMATWLSH